MGRACSAHGEEANVCKILVDRPERTTRLGRPKCRWENNIKMDLREIRWGGMDWIHLAQDKDRWRAFMNMVTNLGFHNMLENS
jgi:hypothetical protein